MTTETSKHLLRDRRFWPLFLTQFLGAFNDNVLKNALVILIAFEDHTLWIFSSKQMVAICGGIFILPFFFFSATAGQLADKYSKPKIVFWIKVSEIAIAGVGAFGFVRGEISFLLIALFLMGLHSTFFGPVKYSILPQLLRREELVSGTAYVEMGTFVAILLGTILGGVLIAQHGSGPWLVGAAVIVLAVLGCLSSTRIIRLAPVAPSLRIPIVPLKPTVEIVRLTAKDRNVFLAVLGISWFWCLGAAFLSLLPSYCKEYLNAEELVVTLFLALFSVGVGAGSLLCSRLSFQKLELGLVPSGALGLSLFALDLFLAGRPEALAVHPAVPIGISELLSTLGGWRLVVDFLFFAIAGGFFIVPLYTAMQQRSAEGERSRVVAGNNILNALAMVLSAVLLVLFFSFKLTIPQVFLVLAFLNGIVACIIFSADMEFLSRAICWIFCHIVHRTGIGGEGCLPSGGGALLVARSGSPLDWMVVATACGQPVRFVTPDGRLAVPFAGRVFRGFLLHRDTRAGEVMADRVRERIEAGDVVCVFVAGEEAGGEEFSREMAWLDGFASKGFGPVVPVSIDRIGPGSAPSGHSESPARFFSDFGSRLVLTVGRGVPADAFSTGRLPDFFMKRESHPR